MVSLDVARLKYRTVIVVNILCPAFASINLQLTCLRAGVVRCDYREVFRIKMMRIKCNAFEKSKSSRELTSVGADKTLQLSRFFQFFSTLSIANNSKFVYI